MTIHSLNPDDWLTPTHGQVTELLAALAEARAKIAQLEDSLNAEWQAHHPVGEASPHD